MPASIQLQVTSRPSLTRSGQYTLTLEVVSTSSLPRELFVMRRFGNTQSQLGNEYRYFRVSSPRDLHELGTTRVTDNPEYRVSKISMDLSSAKEVAIYVSGIKTALANLSLEVDLGEGVEYLEPTEFVLSITGDDA